MTKTNVFSEKKGRLGAKGSRKRRGGELNRRGIQMTQKAVKQRKRVNIRGPGDIVKLLSTSRNSEIKKGCWRGGRRRPGRSHFYAESNSREEPTKHGLGER